MEIALPYSCIDFLCETNSLSVCARDRFRTHKLFLLKNSFRFTIESITTITSQTEQSPCKVSQLVGTIDIASAGRLATSNHTAGGFFSTLESPSRKVSKFEWTVDITSISLFASCNDFTGRLSCATQNTPCKVPKPVGAVDITPTRYFALSEEPTGSDIIKLDGFLLWENGIVLFGGFGLGVSLGCYFDFPRHAGALRQAGQFTNKLIPLIQFIRHRRDG
mmetsp:Transcript_27162/g.63099  ORF Transcript_27162/g.63099 Transcript_27162/m.63099 type:complete len:220 (-) Transcript_27162:432-1091(-)